MKSFNDKNNQETPEALAEEQENKIIQAYTGSVMSLNEIDLPIYKRNTFLIIVIGILKEMTDFRLLFQNVGFLLITISNFFLFTGYFTPFLYITKIAESHGVSNAKASFLISIIGKLAVGLE